jgi:hypothetical protein
MPLRQSPSKQAFKKNVETEMKANPSPDKRKQNLAIAYAIQKKNRMAHGGMTGGEGAKPLSYARGGEVDRPTSPDYNAEAEASIQRAEERKMAQDLCPDCSAMASGGPVCMYHGGLKEDQNTPVDELGHITNDPGKPDQEDQYFSEGGEASSASEQILEKRRASNPEVMSSQVEESKEDNDEALLKELYDQEGDDEEPSGLAERVMRNRRFRPRT